MAYYNYEIVETGEIVKVNQRLGSEPLKSIFSEKLNRTAECRRIISNDKGVNFTIGDNWRSPPGMRYKSVPCKYGHIIHVPVESQYSSKEETVSNK